MKFYDYMMQNMFLNNDNNNKNNNNNKTLVKANIFGQNLGTLCVHSQDLCGLNSPSKVT